MRKILSLILITVCILTAFADDKLLLNGRVRDAVTKRELTQAYAVMYDSAGAPRDTCRANKSFRWNGHDAGTIATFFLGVPKVDSAEQRIKAINPDVRVEKHSIFLTPDNVGEVISHYDFVIEATDSFAVKYMVKDACVAAGKPFCIGGILRFEGQLMTCVPGSACYRCIFPVPPEPEQVPSGKDVGVLGVTPGITGSLQAAEAIKWITGTGQLLVNRLLTFDIASMEFNTIPFARNADCAACGKHLS